MFMRLRKIVIGNECIEYVYECGSRVRWVVYAA